MCVIINKKLNSTLPEATFKKAWARNRDGGGYVAISKDGKVFMEKGIMDEGTFLEKTKPFFGKDWNLVLHFRIQSRGGVNKDLTHPFDFTHPDTPDKKRFLFHNGTVKCLSALSAGHSDTSTVASMLVNLSDDDALAVLKNLNSKGHGRFAVVIGQSVHVYGDEESVTKKGLWLSNLRHEIFDPKKDKAPTVGDGADDYGDHTSWGYGCYGSKYTGASKGSYTSYSKVELLDKILEKEAEHANVPENSRKAWKQEIIKDYELDKLSYNEVLTLSEKKSTTPLLDYYLEGN